MQKFLNYRRIGIKSLTTRLTRPETNAHNVALESPIDLLDLFVY